MSEGESDPSTSNQEEVRDKKSEELAVRNSSLQQSSSQSPRQQEHGGGSTLNSGGVADALSCFSIKMLYALQCIELEKRNNEQALSNMESCLEDLKERLSKREQKNFTFQIEQSRNLLANEKEILEISKMRGRMILISQRISKQIPQEKSLRREQAMQNHLRSLETDIEHLEWRLEKLSEERKKFHLSGSKILGWNEAKKENLQQMLASTEMAMVGTQATIEELGNFIERTRKEILESSPESLLFYDNLKRTKNLPDPLALILTLERNETGEICWQCDGCGTFLTDRQVKLVKAGVLDSSADCSVCQKLLFWG